MVVKFNDLKKQYDAVKNFVEPRITELHKSSSYILGKDVEIFEKNWAKYIGCKYCVGLSSGTDAITLAADSLIEGRTLFITQANTYIATILGLLNTASNIAIDIIDCDLYGQINIDWLEIVLDSSKYEFDTIVVVPVHMYGACADVYSIHNLQQEYNFKILEDSAQAHGTVTNTGLKTGNIGDVAAFSFYPGKNLGACGDAGCITTNNKEIYERILKTRNMGSLVKYEHELPGFNARLDSIQAIILDEKLKLLNCWNSRRTEIAEIYSSELKRTYHPLYCQYNSYHLFPYFTNIPQKYLQNKDIQFGQHYPLSIPQALEKYPSRRYDCVEVHKTPVADNFAKNHITLPIHPYMTNKEVEYVCSFFTKSRISIMKNY